MVWPEWIKSENVQWGIGIAVAVLVSFVIYWISCLANRRSRAPQEIMPQDTSTVTTTTGDTISTHSGTVITGVGHEVTINQTLDSNPGSQKEISQAIAALKAQLETKDNQLARKDDHIEQLTNSVVALAEQKNAPDAPPGIEEALASLAEGKTAAAEAVFQDVIDRKSGDIKEAAAAYQHIGALAFLHDTQKALSYYRRSVELDPDNANGWNQVGHLERRIGSLNESVTAYEKVLQIGEKESDRMLVAVAYGNLGNLYRTRGELEKAEKAWSQSKRLFTEIGAVSMVEKVQSWIDGLKNSSES